MNSFYKNYPKPLRSPRLVTPRQRHRESFRCPRRRATGGRPATRWPATRGGARWLRGGIEGFTPWPRAESPRSRTVSNVHLPWGGWSGTKGRATHLSPELGTWAAAQSLLGQEPGLRKPEGAWLTRLWPLVGGSPTEGGPGAVALRGVWDSLPCGPDLMDNTKCWLCGHPVPLFAVVIWVHSSYSKALRCEIKFVA